jgi:hypothetical protein
METNDDEAALHRCTVCDIPLKKAGAYPSRDGKYYCEVDFKYVAVQMLTYFLLSKLDRLSLLRRGPMRGVKRLLCLVA